MHCISHIVGIICIFVTYRNFPVICSCVKSSFTHTPILQPFFRDYPVEPLPEEIFWALWCTGRYQRQTDRHWLGASPSGLISDPLPYSPIFVPDALPATTLRIYPGLGPAPNVLDCIPSGLVKSSLVFLSDCLAHGSSDVVMHWQWQLWKSLKISYCVA